MSGEFAQQPLPAIVLTPDDFDTPEKSAASAQLAFDTLAKALQDAMVMIDSDERMTDTRVAHGMATMQGVISFDRSVLPADGEVAYVIDGGRSLVFGSITNPAPGGGGLPPLVGGSGPLLDGNFHTDTLAGTVVLGDVIHGNGTPKWARLAGNITTTRKFLRQTGTGAISAVPVWDTLVAADIPTLASAGGWIDSGTIVSLITNTDQVGIGSATPGACLGIININGVGDVVVKITAKASQTAAMIQMLASTGRARATFDKQGSLFIGNGDVSGLDTAIPCIIGMGSSSLAGSISGPTNAYITWMDNNAALSDPSCTTTMVPCAGARMVLYKDAAGTYDTIYGQSLTASWFMVSDETILYEFWTGVVGGTSFYRCVWAGNGDLTNYGKIRSRKNLGAASKGVPGIELEETGAGVHFAAVRAPAVLLADRTQLLQDINATFVMVGDDPPAVASRALGKVDSTAQAAAIGSTNLSSSAPVAMYRVSYQIATTTSDVTAGTIQFQINYTDVIGATNQTGAALALTATGRDRGTFVVQLSSGELSYQTNLVGIIGSARYSLHVRVELLG